MSSVDDRIVNMKFNNKQFGSGVTQSKKDLVSLEKTLANTGRNKSFANLGGAVSATSNKFSALQVAGVTALATISSKATLAGLALLKSLTIEPFLAGFREYETNLNSIQTIMANTGKSVSVVNRYLGDLNEYSDQTIYSFSQMADSIGKFTAAGVDLDAATSSIKGLANTAALSGSNVQQLNTAMYQMSQALSTGSVHLMDWNSLANAGMGGKNIREALQETNRTLGDNGAAMDTAIASAGNFRDSLASGWLTAETFNKTMKVMAGTVDDTGKTVAYTVEELKKMGYSEEAAKKLTRLSAAAIESATKIKTFSQLLDVVKESIGSGWAKIFQDLFGNFNQATAMWTKVGNSITGVIGDIFTSVDEMLVGWRKLGGYKDLWAGFGNIFQALGNLIAPFVIAFKSLLPTTNEAGSGLAKASSAFEEITGWLEYASRGALYLTPVMVSLFGVFKKIGVAIGVVVTALAPLGKLLQQAARRAGDLATEGANIASSLIDGIASGLKIDKLQSIVTDFANNIVVWIKNALGIHSPAAELIPVGYNIAMGIATGLIDGVGAVVSALGKIIGKIFDGAGQLFEGFDAMDWASLFNAVLTGMTILAVKKGVDLANTAHDILGSLVGVIDEVGNSLKVWQHSLQAKMILDIAIAVGILAASLIALSMLDAKQLATGLGAITALLGTLSLTMLALSKIESDRQMAVLALSIAVIGAAMVALATAVTILGRQDPEKVAQGIGAIAIIMGILVSSMLAFSKIQGSIAGMAGSIFVIALAMNALAAAVLAFGNMDMGTLAKGLGSVAVGLGLFVAALLVLDKMSHSVEGIAGAIFIISAAMVVLSMAVLSFGKMDMKTLAKGFGAIAIGLGIMVAALLVLSGNSAGVMAAAGAMVLIATAMNMLVSVVLILGSAPWDVVAKGLGFFAAGLAILLVAGAAAMAVGPGLIVLGQAVALLGLGMLAAGVGMAAFGTGFALMAATGTAGVAVMVAAIHAFIALLPEIATQIAASIVAVIKVFANSSDELRDSFGKIIANILGVISDSIPELGHLFQVLITTGIKIIKRSVPQYIEAGLTIIDKFIGSIAKHVPHMADQALKGVRAFIKAIGDNLGPLADAAAKMVIQFVNAIANAIDNNVDPLRAAGLNLAHALINGLTGGLLDEGVDAVRKAAAALANSIPEPIRKLLDIRSPSRVMREIGVNTAMGLAKGLQDAASSAVQAAISLANAVVSAGNKTIAAAMTAARTAQSKAYADQARADIKAQEAREAARYANKHKKDKEAQKKAQRLQKEAEKAQKIADASQSRADTAAENVQKTSEFQNADLQGKGDIRSQQAGVLADKASQMLAKANAEAARARELMKTNKKAARALLEQAQKDAKEAQRLAEASLKSQKEADYYYAQEVKARIKQMEDETAAEEKALADQQAYDSADAAGKSEILTQRAAAHEAEAKAAKEQALALIEQAKALADTDARKAQELLDQAEAASQDAKEAARQAAEERQQAQEVLSSGSEAISGGMSFSLSNSALEEAAKAVDRYTESLATAAELAAAAPRTVQFVQTNTSPESLSPSEIYRNTKNLLTLAEIKMGEESQ